MNIVDWRYFYFYTVLLERQEVYSRKKFTIKFGSSFYGIQWFPVRELFKFRENLVYNNFPLHYVKIFMPKFFPWGRLPFPLECSNFDGHMIPITDFWQKMVYDVFFDKSILIHALMLIVCQKNTRFWMIFHE